MKRDTFKFLEQEYARVENMIALYESNQIALTKAEKDELYDIRRSIPDRVTAICKHKKFKVVNEPWCDVEYGCARWVDNYTKRCLKCDTILETGLDPSERTYTKDQLNLYKRIGEIVTRTQS